MSLSKIGIIEVDDYSLMFGLLCINSGLDVIFFDKDTIKLKNISQGFYITEKTIINKLLFETKKIEYTSDINQLIETSDLIFSFTENEKNNFVNITEIVSYFYKCVDNNISVFDKCLIIGQTTDFGKSSLFEEKLSQIGVLFANINKINIFDSSIEDIIIVGTKSQNAFSNISNVYNKIIKSNINYFLMSTHSVEASKILSKTYNSLEKSFLNLASLIVINEGIGTDLGLILKYLEKTNLGLKIKNFGLNSIEYDEIKKMKFLIEKNKIENDFITPIMDFEKEYILYLKNYYIKLNPDKKVPFIIKDVVDTKKIDLCVNLINEGYYIHIIEDEKNFQKLKFLIEEFENKVKFFKKSTNPTGYLINV